MAIDLNLVLSFAKVVETGSFTAAGAALGLPKSSVSRAINRLEDALGVRLLQRTTRKLGLTPAGAGYLAEVRGPIAQLTEASADVTEQGRQPRGLVRLTTVPEIGAALIPGSVAAFCARYAGIEVDVVVTNRRVNLVAEGIDLAVRAGRLDDSTLVARKVARSDLVLVAAPGYLGRRGRPRRVADLAAHACLRYRSAVGVFPWRLTGPRGVEQVTVSGQLVVDDLGWIREAALAGLGVALLPDLAVLADVARGALERLLPSYAVRGGAMYVVSPPLQHVPARVALLREHLIRDLPRRLAG